MKICYEKVITDALPISSAVICDGGSGWHHVHPEFELSLVEAGRGIRCVGSNIGNYRPQRILPDRIFFAVQFFPGSGVYSKTRRPDWFSLWKPAPRQLRFFNVFSRRIRLEKCCGCWIFSIC